MSPHGYARTHAVGDRLQQCFALIAALIPTMAGLGACPAPPSGEASDAQPLDVYYCELPDPDPRCHWEAQVPDAEAPCPEVHPPWWPDNRPYSPWCGDTAFPGEDPSALPLTDDPPTVVRGASLDGTMIVYSRADGTYPNSGMDFEIYTFDLTSWSETQITDRPDSIQEDPDIHGSTLIWSDRRYAVGGLETYLNEIMSYDLMSNQEDRITNSVDQKLWPQLNDESILYTAYPPDALAGELRLFDRRSLNEIVLSLAERVHEGEALGSRYVSWVAIPPGRLDWNKDVHIHDLQTGETIRLESTRCARAALTSVSGSKVVWEDWRNGDSDIYLYDMETGEERQLTTAPFDQIGPFIHNHLVAYIDYRYTGGGWDEQECANDITILDLDTMVERRVTRSPWYWGAKLGDNGQLLAIMTYEHHIDAPAKLFLFDLVAMGVLDATTLHVLPEP